MRGTMYFPNTFDSLNFVVFRSISVLAICDVAPIAFKTTLHSLQFCKISFFVLFVFCFVLIYLWGVIFIHVKNPMFLTHERPVFHII